MAVNADTVSCNGRQVQQKPSHNWLIAKSLDCLDSDKAHEARAWILTAKSLYPKDFSVQHEVLQMQISSGQLRDAAMLLYTLLRDFPQEERLWDIVEKMMFAVDGRRQMSSTEQETLAALFAELDGSQQQKTIMLFAEHIRDDRVKYCRVLMLSMRLHPETVRSCAIPALSAVVEKTGSVIVSNESGRMLVMEVLPTILSSRQVGLLDSTAQPPPSTALTLPLVTFLNWLEWIVSFYLDLVSSKPPASLCTSPLLSPTRSHCSSIDHASPSYGEYHESQPWRSAWLLLSAIAEVCEWNGLTESGVLEKGLSVSERVQKLVPFVSRLHGMSSTTTKQQAAVPSQPSEGVLSAFYPAVITWLEACWCYSHVSSPAGSAPGRIVLLDLPQKKSPENASIEPSAKRRRCSETTSIQPAHISLHPSLCSSGAATVLQFEAALQSSHLLKSMADSSEECKRVLSLFDKDKWPWVCAFHRDLMVYNGDLEKLSDVAAKAEEDSNEVGLQRSFALFAGGRVDEACRQALGIFYVLCEEDGTADSHMIQTSRQAAVSQQPAPAGCRQLQLTPYTPCAVVPLLVQMLICYFESMGLRESTGDSVLGHLLVLCQYDWPKHEPVFSQVSEIIKQKGSFAYPKFFDYVVNVDILEEVSFLHSSGSKLVLSSGTGSSSKRTVTRGVNKGAMEEVRNSLERQVMTVDSSFGTITQRIILFLREEKLL